MNRRFRERAALAMLSFAVLLAVLAAMNAGAPKPTTVVLDRAAAPARGAASDAIADALGTQAPSLAATELSHSGGRAAPVRTAQQTTVTPPDSPAVPAAPDDVVQPEDTPDDDPADPDEPADPDDPPAEEEPVPPIDETPPPVAAAVPAPGTPSAVACVAGDMVDVVSFGAPGDGGPVSSFTLLQATSAEGPYLPLLTAESADEPFTVAVSEIGTRFYKVYATGPGGEGGASESVTNGSVSLVAEVGAAGALLRSSNGEVLLQFAPGCFAEPATVTIREIEGSPVGTLLRLAGVYEIKPSGTLGAPARLSVAFTASVTHFQVLDAILTDAELMTFDALQGVWVPGASNVVAADGYVSGDVTHFSYWTGAIVQPHGTDQTTYCSSGTYCHNLSAYPDSSTLIASRNPQVCYNCHGSLSLSGPPAGATGENVEAAIRGGATVSKHPVALPDEFPSAGTVYCTICHDAHGKPSASPSLLRAPDAITGLPVQGFGGARPGDAYCWACHGIIYNRRVNFMVDGYYTRTEGNHRTYYEPSAHAQIDTDGPTCLLCHTAHGSPYTRLLNADLRASTPESVADDRVTGAYAQACLQCHDGSWTTQGAADIKRHVTFQAAETGVLVSGGHRVKSAGGSLPVEAPLPCTECHGPHGSARGNTTLLADTLGASLGTASPAGVRRLCLSCHVTSDLLGWDSTSGTYAAVPDTASVVGLSRTGGSDGSGPNGQGYNWLRLKPTTGHASGDAQSCYECHGGSYASADANNVHNPATYPLTNHLASPASADITIKSVSYGSFSCATCHALDLYTEHDKASASTSAADCSACHPTPRSSLSPWSKGCAQGNCHAGTSTDPMHGAIDVAHDSPVVTCTTGAGCHSSSTGLAALHVNGKRSVGGVVRTSCALCHAAGVPATSDCATCHGYSAHPAHTVSGPCIGSNCHASDAMTIHNGTVSKCQACHAPSKTKSFSCAACHVSPHPNQVGVLNHGGPAEYCVSCHTTANLKGIHADKCMTCHSVVRPAYTGGCSQAGCHVASGIHTGIPGWYDGHHTDHGEGSDCWDCHGHSECQPCHANVYERALPITTSDARSSYTAAAVIHLTAVDQGQSGDTSGIAATYYQVDGGPLQTGTSITVMGPATGSKSHSIEFWSVDNNRNIETHHVAYFDVVAGTDTNPPAGSMAINGGAAYARSTWVTLNNTVNDAETGVASLRIDPGTGVFGAWIDYSPAPLFSVPAGDGLKNIRAEFRDAFGNTLALSDSIVVDTVLPTGTWSINNGAPATNSLDVTITSSISDANGVTSMRAYNSGFGTWSEWTEYSAAKPWTLAGVANGSRTVQVQFADAAGNVYFPSGRSIIYDITAPIGTATINNGAPFTSTTSVTINSAVTDSPAGMSQMRYSNDGVTWSAWETYTASKNWALDPGEGERTVYCQYSDRAGNVLSLSDTITLGVSTDTIPPTGTIAISGGADWTRTLSVTLALNATDNEGGFGVFDMQFSNDNLAWGPWIPYATSANWSLAGGANGARTVYVRYRDGAGNVSTDVETISDTIGYDNLRPGCTVLINGGAYYTDNQVVSIAVSGNDGTGSGVVEMRFSNDMTNWSAWQPFASPASWTLSSGADMKYVYAQVRDAAGNESWTTSDSIAYLLQYTLTYTAGANGTISGTSPQTVPYMSSGTTVTGVPNGGYRWLGWSDGSATNPRTDINVTGNINVSAYFGLTGTHTVRFLTDGYGYVSGQWIQAIPTGGSTTSVTVVSWDTNYYNFREWVSSTGVHVYTPTLSLTNVTSDETWTAYFDVTGTCPFLYTWDGTKYVFEADEFAAGYIGLRTSKGYRRPNPLDYHVTDTVPAVKDGALEYKLVEERDETDFIDQAKLYTIDAPADREVYVERSQAEGVGQFTTLDAVIHTTARDLQPPPSVTWVNTGQDVRDLVSATDGDYLLLNENRNAGFTYQTLEIDCGDVTDAPMVKLVIDGRTMVPTSPAGRAYSRLFGPQVKFEVQDATGAWVAVPATTEILPKPPEFDRPFVLDLTNVWVSDSRKVRMTYLYKTYFDSILLDTTADVPVTITELPLISADLQPHGFNARSGIGELFEYVYGTPLGPARYKIVGNYTRFGDVTPLLQGPVDDKFVIFGGGDEITMRFAPPESSWSGTRRYLFLSDGYYKTLKEDLPYTVEPLPFAAMSNYPYPDTEHYPDDAEHQAYISEYNTRYENDRD